MKQGAAELLVGLHFLIPVALLLALGAEWYLIGAGHYDPVRDDGLTPGESVAIARIHCAIAVACVAWLVCTSRKWMPLLFVR